MNTKLMIGCILTVLISACSTPVLKYDGAKGKQGSEGTPELSVQNIDGIESFNSKSTINKLVIDCSKCKN